MAWEDVKQNEIWNKEENKQLIGTLKDKQVGKFEHDNYIVDVDGKETLVWGSSGLQIEMRSVKIGDKIKIEYNGKKKNPNTGREYDDYHVQVDR